MILMPIHTPTPESNSTGTILSSRAVADRDTRSIGRSVSLVWKRTLSGQRGKTVNMARPRRPGALTRSGMNGREAQRIARMIIGTRTDRRMNSTIKPWLPYLKTLTVSTPLDATSAAVAVPTERAMRMIGSTTIQKTTMLNHMTPALLWDLEQRPWEADTPTCQTTKTSVRRDGSTDALTAIMSMMPSSPRRESW